VLCATFHFNFKVVAGLAPEYVRTSFLIYNLEDGQLVKGCTVVTNELIKACVSSNHLFINFRDSQLTSKIVVFDAQSGQKVGSKGGIGDMRQANLVADRMVLLSTASLRQMSGTAEVFCYDLRGLSDSSEGRKLCQDDVTGTRDLQKVLNHQAHFFSYSRGVIKDADRERLTFMEFSPPLNFRSYPHDHVGCPAKY
jgi:hypothetical protein